MKKLSLLISLSLIPTLSYSATVYDKDGTVFDAFGSVDAVFMNDQASRAIRAFNGKNNNDNTLLTRVKFGVAGRTKINDTVSAIAFSQWDMPTGNHGKDSIKANSQYIGIDARQYGILTFGRGDTAFYTVAGATDVFTQLDQNVNDYYAFGDNQSSLIMYSLSTLGWDFRLSMQTSVDDVNSTNVDVKNGAAFAMSTTTKSGVTVAYGLNYTDFRYDNNINKVSFFAPNIFVMHEHDTNDLVFAYDNKPSWKVDKGLSISYGTVGEGLYAALVGTITKYDKYTNHLYSVEALLSYAFNNGLTLSSYYGVKRFNGANVIANAAFGAYYNFAPSFKVYAEGSFDISSKPERYYSKQQITNRAIGENKALVGAQYSF